MKEGLWNLTFPFYLLHIRKHLKAYFVIFASSLHSVSLVLILCSATWYWNSPKNCQKQEKRIESSPEDESWLIDFIICIQCFKKCGHILQWLKFKGDEYIHRVFKFSKKIFFDVSNINAEKNFAFQFNCCNFSCNVAK